MILCLRDKYTLLLLLWVDVRGSLRDVLDTFEENIAGIAFWYGEGDDDDVIVIGMFMFVNYFRVVFHAVDAACLLIVVLVFLLGLMRIGWVSYFG